MARWQLSRIHFRKAATALLRDFRATLLLIAVVLGLSLITQVSMGVGALSLGQLSASRANPIGVVTSVFAHYDWVHLEANVVGLLFFGGAFVFTNFPMGSAERARRSLWFAVASYPIAVTVNIVYIVLAPGSTSGASGLVYAAFGIGFVFFVTNARDEAALFVKLFRAAHDDGGSVRLLRSAFWWLGMDVALVAVFLYLIVFDLPALFGTGSAGINAFAHLLGFLFGFVATLGWHYRSQSVSAVPR